MHHEDLLQGEIEDLQREILALKHSSNVIPFVKSYLSGDSGSNGWYSIIFKPGESPIMTEISAPGASVTALTPTKINGVDVQSVQLMSQSWVSMIVYSTRPVDHITRAQPQYDLIIKVWHGNKYADLIQQRWGEKKVCAYKTVGSVLG